MTAVGVARARFGCSAPSSTPSSRNAKRRAPLRSTRHWAIGAHARTADDRISNEFCGRTRALQWAILRSERVVTETAGRARDEWIQICRICEGRDVERICGGDLRRASCRDDAAFRTCGKQRSMAIFSRRSHGVVSRRVNLRRPSHLPFLESVSEGVYRVSRGR